MVRLLVLVLFSSVLFSSCYSQRKSNVQDPVKEYKENFDSYRPQYKPAEEMKLEIVKLPDPIVPKNHINKFLTEKLDSVYFYNANICCADGYRILIYSGSNKEDARNYRNNAYEVLPFEKAYMDWVQPSFKVKVGDFIDKLEAYYAYARLVRVFPNAIVVPDKVNIVRE